MNLPLRIALRYLVSKKSHSTVNTISIISICGVAVTTMAIICTLSVFNGFQELIASLYSTFDPQIKITPNKGKTFDASNDTLQSIALWPEVEVFSPVVEENAMLVYRDKQMPALIKGVDANFSQLTQIDSILLDGTFMLADSIANYATLGVGLANFLETGARYAHALEVFAPKRNAKINIANPTNAFNKDRLFLTAVFSINQEEYDNQLAIVPIAFARKLFDYTTEATALEIKLAPEANEEKLIQKIKETLGENFSVKNRMQQQEATFRVTQLEKWLAFLILSFILLIAVFNIIGSLSMLIIDKQKDIKTLSQLGADDSLISKIFLTESWLISIIGAGSGLLSGIILCQLQQHFGFIQLGENAADFIIDAYPVKLIWSDVLIVLALVSILGYLIAWYPVKYLRSRWLQNHDKIFSSPND